jgi:hypothetical protein
MWLPGIELSRIGNLFARQITRWIFVAAAGQK